jgi:hypothetical protein
LESIWNGRGDEYGRWGNRMRRKDRVGWNRPSVERAASGNNG